MPAENDAVRTVILNSQCGKYRRLEITDRGAYQRVLVHDRTIGIGEFCFSVGPEGCYEFWSAWGETLAAEELKLAGL